MVMPCGMVDIVLGEGMFLCLRDVHSSSYTCERIPLCGKHMSFRGRMIDRTGRGHVAECRKAHVCDASQKYDGHPL